MLLTAKKIKNVMFDLDGTLINSEKDVSRILIQMVNKNGGNLSADTKIKLGPPLIDMIKISAPDLTEEQAYNAWREYGDVYKNDDLPETKPYDGIIELLKQLKALKINVFIVTYKPKDLAVDILDRFFKGLYLDILTPTEIENFSQGKTKTDMLKLLFDRYNLKAEESLMVGDAGTDISGGQNAGTYAIGVLYGHGEAEELSKADFKAKNVQELEKIILELI
ncbi:HAD family hydrolase [bacterium]|nr:HAD family hydrolase [bacterium]